MDMIKFVVTGLFVAIAAGVLGTAVVGLIEILRAYMDPVRRDEIMHRDWRENLRQMLH